MGCFTRDPFAALLHPHRLEVIVMVGARDGADALDLRASYQPSMLHAFEPDPGALAACRAALRGVPGIALHPYALWDRPGRIALTPTRPPAPAGAEGRVPDAPDVEAATVRAAILANVMAAEGLPRVDLLCLDAGAAALPVLRGAGARIADVRFVLAGIAPGQRAGVEAHLGSAGFLPRAEEATRQGEAPAVVLFENAASAGDGRTAPARRPDAARAGFLARFRREWAPRLGARADTFRGAFELLSEPERPAPLILELGCLRKRDRAQHGPPTPPDHPWEFGGWEGPWSEGMSTLLFDRFAEACGGRLVSVDRDPAACAVAREATSARTTTVLEADSLAVLAAAATGRAAPFDPAAVDLLYLDTFGTDWDAPDPEAGHHAREIEAILPLLRPGCLILVDDCRDARSGREGPGRRVVGAHLRGLGLSPVAEGFQELWRRP